MSNDRITVNRRQAADPTVKLAICHALAQSTKLCVYEERVVDLVLRTKHLPQQMADHGAVRITAKEIAQLIGHGERRWLPTKRYRKCTERAHKKGGE